MISFRSELIFLYAAVHDTCPGAAHFITIQLAKRSNLQRNMTSAQGNDLNGGCIGGGFGEAAITKGWAVSFLARDRERKLGMQAELTISVFISCVRILFSVFAVSA